MHRHGAASRTGCSGRRCALGGPGGEEPVDLADPVLEGDDRGGLRLEDVLPDVVLPVHLEHQAAGSRMRSSR